MNKNMPAGTILSAGLQQIELQKWRQLQQIELQKRREARRWPLSRWLRREEERVVKDVHQEFQHLLWRSERLYDDAKRFTDISIEYKFTGTYDKSYYDMFVEQIMSYKSGYINFNRLAAHYDVYTERRNMDPGFKWAACFQFFTCNTYSSHPWHHHYQMLTQIFTDIDNVYFGVRKFCQESFELSRSYGIRMWMLLDKVTNAEVNEQLKDAASKLYNCAKRICSLVQPLQGRYYGKAWAVEVALKNNKERTYSYFSNVIETMIADGHIPCTSKELLYKLIQLKKKDKFFIDDEWKAVGNNRRMGLILAMVPVKMRTRTDAPWYYKWRTEYFYEPDPNTKIELYEPPKPICL